MHEDGTAIETTGSVNQSYPTYTPEGSTVLKLQRESAVSTEIGYVEINISEDNDYSIRAIDLQLQEGISNRIAYEGEVLEILRDQKGKSVKVKVEDVGEKEFLAKSNILWYHNQELNSNYSNKTDYFFESANAIEDNKFESRIEQINRWLGVKVIEPEVKEIKDVRRVENKYVQGLSDFCIAFEQLKSEPLLTSITKK